MDHEVTRLAFALERFRPLEAMIGSNCYIGLNVEIGEGVEIHHNVVIVGKVTIGNYCRIKSGTVIGEDGFGYATDEDGLPVRITHTGGVVIGDHVEIGALNTICSGTVDHTVICDHVKTDDHVHIAHNCKIGRGTLITACAEISGSVTIGERCWLGPNCSIMNKITIGDGALIGLGAVVLKDVESGAVMAGNPARQLRKVGTE